MNAARPACLPARARAARLDRAWTDADNSAAIAAFSAWGRPFRQLRPESRMLSQEMIRN